MDIAEILPRLAADRLIQLATVLSLVVLAVWTARRWIGRHVASVDRRYQARKLTSFIGFIGAFLVVAIVFNDVLGRFTVAFGVAGAGIAFALQEVIASVAGWIALSFGGFFRVGDRVELGGIKGDVIDIGVLRTTLMEMGGWVAGDQYNGRIVRVANSFVFKEPVFNYSADFPFLWDEIKVPLKYGSDFQFAQDLIERVAQAVVGDYARAAEASWEPVTRRYRIEPASVRPSTTMVAHETGIEFTLRYVVDYKARRSTKHRLFRRLLEEIDAAADRLSIGTAGLSIDKTPPIEVDLRDR